MGRGWPAMNVCFTLHLSVAAQEFSTGKPFQLVSQLHGQMQLARALMMSWI